MRRALFAGAAAGAMLLGWLVLGDEVPRWRADGSAIVPHDALPELRPFRLSVLQGGTIIAQGDSLTKGTHGGRDAAGKAYPRWLAQSLGGGVTVVNRGIGGHRAHEGAGRWTDTPDADLAVVMYGTNDSAVRGWLGRFRPVPLPRFESALADIVERFRQRGIPVLLLAPPPTGSEAMERRLMPYREAVRRVAMAEGTGFLDPVEAFAGSDAPLQHDALHFTADGNRALGTWLAGQIEVGRQKADEAAPEVSGDPPASPE